MVKHQTTHIEKCIKPKFLFKDGLNCRPHPMTIMTLGRICFSKSKFSGGAGSFRWPTRIVCFFIFGKMP